MRATSSLVLFVQLLALASGQHSGHSPSKVVKPTAEPTLAPTTVVASTALTGAPSAAAPTTAPTTAPTAAPTAAPTSAPTTAPTTEPTSSPTFPAASPTTLSPTPPTPSRAPTAPTEAPPPVTCGLPPVLVHETAVVPLCIIIDELQYTIFYPEADVFALLEVDGSFVDKTFDNEGVLTPTIRVEMAGVSSHPLQRRLRNYVVPFYTLIITVRDGQIQSLSWDEGCLTCSEPECIVNDFGDKVCGVDEAACTSEVADPRSSDCDLRVFVGWFGTDKSGAYFTSASMRLSAFRGYSAKEAFSSAQKTAEKTAKRF